MPRNAPGPAATPSRDDRLAATKSIASGVLTLARLADRDVRPRTHQTHAVLGVLAIASGARQWRLGSASPLGSGIGAGYVVAIGLAVRSGREERQARRVGATDAARRRGVPLLRRKPAAPAVRTPPGRSAQLAGTSTVLGGVIDLARALEHDPDDGRRTWLAAVAASSILAGVGEARGRPRLQRLGLATALVALASGAALTVRGGPPTST